MSEHTSEPHQGWSSGDIISADNAEVAAEQLDSLFVWNAAEGPLVPGYQDGCPQIPEYARDLVLAGLAHVNLPAGEYARLHYFIKGMWYSSFVLHAIQDPAKDLVQGILTNLEDGRLYSPEARERLFAVIGYIKKRVARGLGEEGKTGKRQARAPAKEREVTPKTLRPRTTRTARKIKRKSEGG
ncbi:hypothetical protein LZ554_004337 [Drepanopeziza brunnea f. sp. 'monogermtubi']|nr:hypothetical protein LZ554_004337 [Drepanopeziza brunnea f. sp. 'monogermtubi']